MSGTPSSSHVYAREISDSERSSLRSLADLIPTGATILDLGCGTGALGRWLQVAGGATLDGATLSEQEAQFARPSYRHIVVGNLEHLDLLEEFQAGGYDAVVCADVLEHLRQPEVVLRQCHKLLKPNGQLLVSVPNASYCGLVAELMGGQFTYREEGLLDRTHLRFYTRSTLLSFLSDQGWLTESLEPIVRNLADSEFKSPFENLPPAVARHLLTQPDALSYQFVLSCRAATPTTQTPARFLPTPSEGQILFDAELFAGNDEGYSQENKFSARGVVGQHRQTITFKWNCAVGNLHRLRLDPADRPGFLHLFGISLLGESGQCLWRWQAGAPTPTALDVGHVPHHLIQWHVPGIALPTPMLLILGNDPWFELPIPPNIAALALSGAGSLEVEMGWPMSADHLFAAQSVLSLKADLHEQQKKFADLHAAMLDGQSHHAATFNKMQDALAEKARQVVDLEHQLQQQATEIANKQSQLDAATAAAQVKQQRLLTANLQLVSQNRDLQLKTDGLAEHLRWIESSTVFRATRPLVRLKIALNRLLSAASPQTQQPDSMKNACGVAPPAYPVDIIVPVYKGLSDTQRCILSALASPCQTPFRLIVLNDASPEPEVTQWLRKIATTDSRITLLENPENLGFVGTVNRGLSQSDTHDVVLLNSDAEVANDWLDRIRRSAYSDAKIGTVTPFSNNATICSYPRFCHANPLVAGHTTASLDLLCASIHPGKAVDVPTGVGFCMYIRRDCLDKVGLFDVANFGKGYGEENDFCQRAHAIGWRNLHALDTFVLHAGGVSFGDSKSARELAAMETLRRLYPDYEAEVLRFIQQDPAQPHRHAIDLARLRHSPLAKVLAVTHDRAGGTLRHVRELAKTLAEQAHFLCLTPIPGGRATLELLGDFEGFKLEFTLETEFDALVEVLLSVNVRLVHFHHLLGHHPRVQALPDHLGVPFDFTAHDHYSFCPQISLTDHTNSYCGEKGEAQCNRCLNRSPAPGGVDIATWRGNHERFLRNSRYILVPSANAARRFATWLPRCDVRVAPHTDMEPEKGDAPVIRRNREKDAPLKVVVIGAMSLIKGADLLEAVAIEAMKTNAPVEFHLIGYAYRSLKTRPKSALTVHGEYAESELEEMLNWLKPDVVWFPALWPETYSYTLSASLNAGLPVIAPDLGAFPERLHNRAWSWVRPWNQSTQEWLAFFAHIHREHILTGTPPTAPSVPTETMPLNLSTRWNYAQDYLPPFAESESPFPTPPTVEWLHSHRPGQAQPGLQGLSTGARQHILIRLARLRATPGLRHIARKIPLRWQTRVKSWLLK